MKTDRYIAVPRDPEAQELLDVSDALDIESSLLLWVLDEGVFSKLWESGILGVIEASADVLLDNCEDENISDMRQISNISNCLRSHSESYGESEFSSKMLSMFEEAYDRSTGVYFYF